MVVLYIVCDLIGCVVVLCVMCNCIFVMLLVFIYGMYDDQFLFMLWIVDYNGEFECDRLNLSF